MGRSQRVKGRRGEQQAVNTFKSYGFKAKRISPLEAGGEDKGDILVDNMWIVSCKIGKQVPIFDYKAIGPAHFLVKRADRKGWLITMTLDSFIENFYHNG